MRWADDAQIGEKNAGATIYVVDTAQYPEDTLRFMVEGETIPRVSLGADGINGRRFQNVSVRDFGAKGDDTTDDTTAIQNALNFVSTAGGIVRFPAGSYKITSSLSLPRGVRLMGEQGTPAQPAFYPTIRAAFTAASQTMIVLAATGTTTPGPIMEYLKLDGGTAGANQALHLVTSADRLDWDWGAAHCAFIRCAGNMIELSKGAVNAFFHQCRFDTHNDYAIAIADGGVSSADNLSVTGGTWDGNPASGTYTTKGFLSYTPASFTSVLSLGISNFRFECNRVMTVSAATRSKALIALFLTSLGDPTLQAKVNLFNVQVNAVAAANDVVLVGQTGASDVNQWQVAGMGVGCTGTLGNTVALTAGATVSGPPVADEYPLFFFAPLTNTGANSSPHTAMNFLGSRPTVTGAKGGNAALTSLCSALASMGIITDSTT